MQQSPTTQERLWHEDEMGIDGVMYGFTITPAWGDDAKTLVVMNVTAERHYGSSGIIRTLTASHDRYARLLDRAISIGEAWLAHTVAHPPSTE